MGMTMTQKILAAHAGLEQVTAGQLIRAKLDIVLGNDITTPVAINEFKKNGFDTVFNKDKIAIGLSGGKDSSLLLYTMRGDITALHSSSVLAMDICSQPSRPCLSI